MKNFITTLFLLFTIFQLKSQDAVFSQFYLSPLNLNPALAGAECGDQLILNYRDQWQTYRTGSFSYDRPFSLKNGNRIGLGAKITNDVAGSAKLQRTNGAVTFSYHKKLFQKGENSHFLSGGIETGWSKRDLDGSALTWGSQHNGQGGVDTTINSGEAFDPVNFFDLGAGLTYLADFKKLKNFQIGMTGIHLNRPDQSFDDLVENRLPVRFVFHIQGDVQITPRFDFRPRVLYTSQGPSELWVGNLGLRYFLNKKATNSLEFGIGRMLNDINTLIISTTFFYKNIGFSVLTEFNGEELNGDGIDSYEGALIYRFCK